MSVWTHEPCTDHLLIMKIIYQNSCERRSCSFVLLLILYIIPIHWRILEQWEGEKLLGKRTIDFACLKFIFHLLLWKDIKSHFIFTMCINYGKGHEPDEMKIFHAFLPNLEFLCTNKTFVLKIYWAFNQNHLIINDYSWFDLLSL